jgi:hypothetical protein
LSERTSGRCDTGSHLWAWADRLGVAADLAELLDEG